MERRNFLKLSIGAFAGLLMPWLPKPKAMYSSVITIGKMPDKGTLIFRGGGYAIGDRITLSGLSQGDYERLYTVVGIDTRAATVSIERTNT